MPAPILVRGPDFGHARGGGDRRMRDIFAAQAALSPGPSCRYAPGSKLRDGYRRLFAHSLELGEFVEGTTGRSG